MKYFENAMNKVLDYFTSFIFEWTITNKSKNEIEPYTIFVFLQVKKPLFQIRI